MKSKILLILLIFCGVNLNAATTIQASEIDFLTGKTKSEMDVMGTFTGLEFTTPVWLLKSDYIDGYPNLDGQVSLPISVIGSNTKDGQYTSLTKASGEFASLISITRTGKTVAITISGDITADYGLNTSSLTYPAMDAGADYFFSKADDFGKIAGVVEELILNKKINY